MSKTYEKPLWLTLAEQLVIQARRDIQAKERRQRRRQQAKHALFGLEQRAHLHPEQPGHGHSQGAAQ